jgi:hypothetical protein
MLNILKLLTGPKPYHWYQVTKRSEKGQELTNEERQVVSRQHCPDCGGILAVRGYEQVKNMVVYIYDAQIFAECDVCGFSQSNNKRRNDRLILIGHNKCPSQKKNSTAKS